MAETTFAMDLVAGTTGGVCGIVVGQPADTVKVRVQTALDKTKTASSVFMQLLRREGPAGFFRGMAAPLAANAPINACVFVTYGGILRYLETGGIKGISEPLQSQHHFAAGAAAGLIQSVFACPGELLKIKQQIHTTTGAKSSLGGRIVPSAWQVATKAVRQVGVYRGLFQGWWLTCARDVPAFGCYFAAYELSKQHMLSKEWSLPVASLASGAVAGMAAWGLFHPIDVLKSCRQGECAIKSKWAEGAQSTWQIAKQCYREHGWRFFVRGITPSVLRAAPVNAVTFCVYEQVMALQKRTDQV
jgi:hypothetical protein